MVRPMPKSDKPNESEPSEPTVLPPKGDPDVLYVIDISSYVFRAYHALPPLSSSKGEPTHAVHGVANMLLKLLRQRDPKRVIVAMDSPSKNSVRKALYPEYKANRPPVPPDLKIQMKRVGEMVEAWEMSPIEAPTYEADDVIATVVERCYKAGLKTVIVSADKDLLQLLRPGVVMYDTMRNRVFGEPETVEKLGVPPNQVRDLLALMGDSSDNVPGVPSVGQKTAAKLLAQWGNLDALYEGVETVKQKALKAKLIANKDQAYLSQELVSLHGDLPIEEKVEELTFSGGDGDALRALFTELELTRLVAQLDPASTVKGHYHLLRDVASLKRVAADIREAGRFAIHTVLDTENAITGSMVGIALAWHDGIAGYLPVDHRVIDPGEQIALADALEVLKPLLENSLFVKFADLKRETMVLKRHGVSVRGVRFDTMIASYVVDPSRHGHSLDAVARAELDAELSTAAALRGTGKKAVTLDEVDVKSVSEYASAWADYTLRLSELMQKRIAESPLGPLYKEVELPLAEVLAIMELNGIVLDAKLLNKMAKDAEKQLEKLEARCTELAGHEFNVASPRQLETILFDELELPVIKKTKTARSTDHQVLEELSTMHELPAAILEFRSLSKLKSTYLDALPREVNEDTGRVHTRYNQAVAATGRLSSSDPNLQNIPIRTEIGRKIREAFVPEKGWSMMSADYSQIELRVLAHLSEDEALLDAYNNDADVHKRTASALFGVDEADVTADMRSQAKTVNFAVIYGQTQFALARNLKIERKEAQRYIDAFFERYSGVRQFMDHVANLARELGYVTTLFGRRRLVADIHSNNHNLRMAAERIAQNTPVQGSAADIIKIAMINIQQDIEKLQMKSRMLLTVHDELVFEAPKEEKKALESLVVDRMQNAMELAVPLEVQVGWGKNWGVAH